MKRQIINLIVIVSIAASAVLFLFYAPNIVKEKLIVYVKQKYDMDFNVRFVSFALFNGVTFHDVNIFYQSTGFKTKRVSVYFNLYELISHRRLADSLRKIYFDQPEINLLKPDDLLLISFPNTKNTDKAASDITVDWENASISINKPEIELKLEEGRYFSSKKLQSIKSTVLVKNTGEFRGELLVDNVENQWKFCLTGKDISLNSRNPFEQLIADKTDKPLNFNGGLNASGKINGHIQGKISFIIEETLKFKKVFKVESSGDIAVNSKNMEAGINLTGINIYAGAKKYSGSCLLAYSTGIFKVSNFVLSNGIEKITLDAELSKQRVSLKSSFYDFDVNNINSNVRGMANGDVFVHGNSKAPVIEAKADIKEMELLKGTIKPRQTKILFNYNSGSYKATGETTFLDKQYSFSLSAGSNTKKSAGIMGTLNIKGNDNNINSDFSLSDSAFEIKKFVITDKAGHTNASMSLKSQLIDGNKRDFVLNCRMTEFAYADNKTSGNMFLNGWLDTEKGLFSADVKVVSMQANGFTVGNIKGSIEYVKDKLTLKGFNAGNYVFLDCNYWPNEDKISGSGSVKKFSLQKLNIDGLDGELNGQFSVMGTLASPEIYFKYNTRKASFSKSSVELIGKGNADINRLVATGAMLIAKENGDYDFAINFKDKQNIRSKIVFNKARAESLNSLLLGEYGFKLPVTGTLNSTVEIKGSFSKPDVLLNLNSNTLFYSGTLMPTIWDSFDFSAKLLLSAKQPAMQIDRLNIMAKEQQVSILPDALIEFSKTETRFNGKLHLENFDFGFGTAYGDIGLAGGLKQMNKNLTFDSIISLDNLWVNEQNIKNLSVAIKYNDADGKKYIEFVPSKCRNCMIAGKIDFTNKELYFSNISMQDKKTGDRLNSTFKLKGMFSEKNINLTAEGSNVGLDYISRIANVKFPLDGNTDFSVVFRGAAQKPYLTGTMNVSAGTIYFIPFTNANINFNYNGSVLTILNSRIVNLKSGKEILALSGKGKVPLALNKGKHNANDSIDLNFQVDGDLSILEAIVEDVKSSQGSIAAVLRISGSVEQPVYGGYLVLNEGNIKSKRYFNVLDRLNVALSFSENKLEVKECSGRIGQGYFKIDGKIMLTGLFDVESYDISLRTTSEKGIRLFIPELPIPASAFLKPTKIEGIVKNYSSGEPHFELALKGKPGDAVLKGYIELYNTHFCYPPPEKTSGGNSVLKDLLTGVNWNMEIRSGENTWYENELVSANIYGGLVLSGKDCDVNGKIESSRGRIEYLGKLYEVKQAFFEVINNDCWLEAKAETSALFSKSSAGTEKEIGTVTMIVPRSPISEISPQFSSAEYPDMSSAELVRRTFGFTEKMSPEDQNYMLSKQFFRLFDAALTSTFAKGIIRRIGIDSVHITPNMDPDTQEANTKPGAAIDFRDTTYEFTKVLNKDLALGYALNLGRLDIRHQFELVYRWKSNIWLRSTYGYQTSGGYGKDDWKIQIEPQWRFGFDTDKDKDKKKTIKK